jgi:MFS family permease
MIVTRQRKIPFIWVIMAMMPWAFWYFQNQVNGVNFFILNRLIDNPAALTFVLGLPGLLFTLIPLGAYISYRSDRIWTRWGRRKIFIIFAFSGWVLVFILYPLAPNIWFFIGLMFIMSFFGAFGSPLETLKLEIIPPYLRGRSAAMWTWITTVINIVFYATVLGRIDEVMPVLHLHLGGEKVLFWSAAGAVLVALFIYLFGIHEIDPESAITGEPFRISTMWKSLTMPQLRYLYVFLFATTFLNTGLGSMGQLLYLNQWGYSTQEFGFNVAVGGVLNLFLIPIVGIFADMGKKNRMAIYLACLGMVLLLNVCYFSYVTWYLPNQRPSLFEIIFFGETTCIFGIIAGMVYYPLVYDYIPRNIMGTYVAGTSILGSIIGFVTSNGLGLFMATWSNIFQPPAGEMVHVCLRQEMPQAQVVQILNNAHLLSPAGTPVAPSDISARPWFANGIVQTKGTCYEIRLRDADADTKAKRRDQLTSEIGTTEAKLKTAQAGNSASEIAKIKTELDSEKTEHDTLDAELKRRTSAWEKQVVAGLGDNVMKAGSEVLGVQSGQAVTFTLPALRKPKDEELNRINRRLRAQDQAFVDARAVVRADHGFELSICSMLSKGENASNVVAADCQRVIDLAATAAPRLVSTDAKPTQSAVTSADIEDVALVEDPVKNFISPISRVVNFAISRFTEVPAPDQKLHSLARELCKDERIAHARADALKDRNGLHVAIVASSAKLKDPKAWASNLVRDITDQASVVRAADLTPLISSAIVPFQFNYRIANSCILVATVKERAWRSILLKDVREQAASLKLTVPTPVVGSGIVPLRYNYMTGYIYVFAMVLLGFGMVMYFIRLEKAGKIRKLGAEEAQSEEQHHTARAESETLAKDGITASTPWEPADQETYTPGYLLPKLGLVIVGLLVATAALRQAWPDLHLLMHGETGEGVVTAVIMQKPGLPEIVLNTQADVIAKTHDVSASKDYTTTFFDEFTFEARDGKPVVFRRDVGCKLKPTLPLLDDDGLPTTATLRYDPADPAHPSLPLELSTWFAPALIFILGIMAALTGAVLALYARKPIVLHSSVSLNVAAPT